MPLSLSARSCANSAGLGIPLKMQRLAKRWAGGCAVMGHSPPPMLWACSTRGPVQRLPVASQAGRFYAAAGLSRCQAGQRPVETTEAGSRAAATRTGWARKKRFSRGGKPSGEKGVSVYILRSLQSNSTYCGTTTNLVLRLKQHNGDAKGGAGATQMNRPWEYLCILSGFPDGRTALQCEWRLKHWDGKRSPQRRAQFQGPAGRIRALSHILSSSDRWTAKSVAFSEQRLTIEMSPEFLELIDVSAILEREGGLAALTVLRSFPGGDSTL